VVGQDLGITLDMEMFIVRARNKGIRLTTDEVVMSASADESGGVVLQILTHTTGAMAEVRADWVVCAVHQAPEDELWQALKGAPFEVHRAGDCVAPRRAHAAVIEGDRVGGAL
jgi:2,4-dienoyl-CoA reductase (NADPH2)